MATRERDRTGKPGDEARPDRRKGAASGPGGRAAREGERQPGPAEEYGRAGAAGHTPSPKDRNR